MDLEIITTLPVYGDETEGNSLPGTPTPRPAAQRSVTKAPGCAPASVSANAFSNPSRAGGGAGKGLTWRKDGRVTARSGVPEVPTRAASFPIGPHCLEKVHVPYVPFAASRHCPFLRPYARALVPRPP